MQQLRMRNPETREDRVARILQDLTYGRPVPALEQAKRLPRRTRLEEAGRFSDGVKVHARNCLNLTEAELACELVEVFMLPEADRRLLQPEAMTAEVALLGKLRGETDRGFRRDRRRVIARVRKTFLLDKKDVRMAEIRSGEGLVSASAAAARRTDPM